MRRSRGVKPFVFFIERQSATIRVSNPNGIPAGKSSCACAADRSNRSIFGSTLFIAFLLLKFCESILHFLPGPKRAHFNERRTPAGDFPDFLNGASLQV